MWIPNTSNFILDNATANIVNVTVTAIRFEREWNAFSHKLNKNPKVAPNTKDKTISNNGSKTIDKIFVEPKLIDLAIPKEIAKIINPTASSNATTGNKISVTGPFALYCFTTIKVAAGAVAVAIAANTIAADNDNLSGIIKCRQINAISTMIVVNTAWNTPIVNACFPTFLSCDILNSLPIEKAMKPNANSLIIENEAKCSCVIPNPLIPNAPNKNGPIKTPAIKYAVTAGNFIFFTTLLNNNPANNAIDKLNNI